MKVLILTNGDYGAYSFCKNIDAYSQIICADNGMKHARQLNIVPDYIIGDFDSSSADDLKYFEGKGVSIKRLPEMKDETDTEIAMDTAIQIGATSIDVFGGLGSRIDHTLGNIHLLYKALNRGVKMTLINPYNQVALIEDGMEWEGNIGQLISLIPLTEEVTGVTTKGLKYVLNKDVFKIGEPYGISNYMTEEKASVTIATGKLLIIKSQD